MTQILYLVRHGNTFDKGDVVTRVGARTDLALSRSGLAQADALAQHFAMKKIHFDAAVSSPLTRTRQTAEAILSAQASHTPLAFADFLREIDYGPDENQPEEDVVARIGEDALRAWEEQAAPPQGWHVNPDQIRADWRNFFAKLASGASSKTTLCVTSNGIARFALMEAQHASDVSLKLKTGAYGVLDISDNGSARVVDWNVRP